MIVFSTFQHGVLIELAILLLIAFTSCANDKVPHVTVKPSSSTVSGDSPVTLKCHDVYPPSSIVQWKFNNKILEENNSYGFTIIGTDLMVSLVPEESKEFVFHCLVHTTLGVTISSAAKVSKPVIHKFEERSDLYLNVSEGSNLVMPCQPPYSHPKAKIMYRYNNSVLIDKDTDHYKILPSGNLQIIKVSLSDQGKYHCMAENLLGNRTRIAKHAIHLHVFNTEVPSQEPAVIMPSAKLEAFVGDNVVLECSAIGNPLPVITWEKYGGKLIPGRYHQLYGNLYLDSVTKEDEGTYLCKADNGLNALMPDGLKALMLDILESPSIQCMNQELNVSLGGTIEMSCTVTGKPRPDISWYQNGNLIPQFTNVANISIPSAKAGHHGIYQCFADNIAGSTYCSLLVNIDITKRDTSFPTFSNQNITKHPPGGELMNKIEPSAVAVSHESKRQKINKEHKKWKKIMKKRPAKDNKRMLDQVKLIPPSKPEVKQLSDTSVMLNWTVPSNEGLQITFFRVQYKEVGQKKSIWRTEDIEIDSHVRTYEVRNLQPRSMYKFRIAAVYSNNDNTHGANSDKFKMKVDPIPESKPPSKEPTIVEVMPIENEQRYALLVKWQHNHVSSAPIEGFYIYYKPYHAKEPFKNVTLLAPTVRSHLLRDLYPGTAYLIKMQSFNSAGNSSFSNEVVKKTKGGSPILSPFPTREVNTMLPPLLTTPEKGHPDSEWNRPSRTGAQSSSEMLYIVLGIVLGVMLLLLIVFMFMCWWKQRQQRRMMDAMNDAVRNKLQDPSRNIYTDSLHKKMMNGNVVLNGINGTIVNGHIPHNYHKMNISVNPLSEMDSTDGSTHYTQSTFHPNGVFPQHQTSDNNSNNIDQSKSLHNSVHHINQQTSPNSGDVDTLVGGESMAKTPSSFICKNVPSSHNVIHDRCSLLSRSCDPSDSTLSYDDNSGVISGCYQKKRRRDACKEHLRKDQATNTDLSSNEGTINLSECNKAISSSQESGHIVDDPTSTKTNSENSPLEWC